MIDNGVGVVGDVIVFEDERDEVLGIGIGFLFYGF